MRSFFFFLFLLCHSLCISIFFYLFGIASVELNYDLFIENRISLLFIHIFVLEYVSFANHTIFMFAFFFFYFRRVYCSVWNIFPVAVWTKMLFNAFIHLYLIFFSMHPRNLYVVYSVFENWMIFFFYFASLLNYSNQFSTKMIYKIFE